MFGSVIMANDIEGVILNVGSSKFNWVSPLRQFVQFLMLQKCYSLLLFLSAGTSFLSEAKIDGTFSSTRVLLLTPKETLISFAWKLKWQIRIVFSIWIESARPSLLYWPIYKKRCPLKSYRKTLWFSFVNPGKGSVKELV